MAILLTHGSICRILCGGVWIPSTKRCTSSTASSYHSSESFSDHCGLLAFRSSGFASHQVSASSFDHSPPRGKKSLRIFIMTLRVLSLLVITTNLLLGVFAQVTTNATCLPSFSPVNFWSASGTMMSDCGFCASFQILKARAHVLLLHTYNRNAITGVNTITVLHHHED